MDHRITGLCENVESQGTLWRRAVMQCLAALHGPNAQSRSPQQYQAIYHSCSAQPMLLSLCQLVPARVTSFSHHACSHTPINIVMLSGF